MNCENCTQGSAKYDSLDSWIYGRKMKLCYECAKKEYQAEIRLTKGTLKFLKEHTEYQQERLDRARSALEKLQ